MAAVAEIVMNFRYTLQKYAGEHGDVCQYFELEVSGGTSNDTGERN